MKMISSTSITSTIGVTLISAIGERRLWRWSPMIGPMAITILPRMGRGTAAAGGGGGGSVEGDEPPPPCCAWSPSPSQGGFSPPSSLLLRFPAQGGVAPVGDAAAARLLSVDPVRHAAGGVDRRER